VSRGRNVFLVVCEAADAAECVRALEPWAWQDLYSYLLENHCEGGISGQVLGMMLVEGARRYARGLEVPATLAEKEGGKI
jgi:hypothetical protein